MAKVAGKKGLPFGLLAMLAIAYVAFGDSFLPGQAGYYSAYARNMMNDMLVNVFPSWETKNPNNRTEEALRRTESGK